eukprot:CAMPEP_0114518148 /NCGR_PEP_ID=MMETSP0109-20121206/18284_1 /TAXON_ID=29199 /ORGANISM="Chlorarachnion reptans, Strain CCCM449" /LENGTH=343 /DNA_ID=CAMNT_0001698739 /DNA_START=114 /DNA_END=1145 /DNA_ORIENTATION=+
MEKERDRQLQKELNKHSRKQEEKKKLLLLGAGQSGKSTLFKQVMILYGDGFSKEERENYRPLISENVISSMQTLVEETEERSEAKVNSKLKSSIEELMQLERVDIDEKIAGIIKLLWEDPAIKATYERRAEFQLNESAKYYFDKIEELGTQNYIPSEADVIRSRSRTTGIIENKFTIDGVRFQMYDVGGQRSERKKWIHCFENVSCLLFVAAISGYNQTLLEDNDTNRLVEAIKLFEEIANSRWFARSSMVLFLNKRDVFKEKLANGIPITVCPELKFYKGSMNYEDTTEFIIEKFLSRVTKDVHTHLTCATDRYNINPVFDSVKEFVMKQCLEAAGLSLNEF